ncbi:precorrin-3B synthase [Rhizobium mesoamericanum]|uniref:Precorrin-3B synthase n=1 Tax=Rhizobium mesoamericanum STM3625 TaxID=1211777 RepID=K0PPM4_9HYPH|nr:precorrin-3B synthase [Rhizobium mesoamericanum]CCM78561.1 Precorrin-3B synthase [Rhizobium mesoamericanum STM3625]
MALGEQTTQNSRQEPSAWMRRGACPTLLEPMQTGDGLLARLRPPGGILSIQQFTRLAEAAQRHGNGIVEITARGSLQIRGLRTETVQPLAADLDAAGISVPPGPIIELSPLYGIAPDEIGNPAEIEALLRDKLAAAFLSPLLAPKLSILIDGGGTYGLAAVTGDIRVTAVSAGIWRVAISGDEQTALPLLTGSPDAAVQAVGDLLHLLMSCGRHKRCRDIERGALLAAFPFMEGVLARAPERKDPEAGTLALPDGSSVLGLSPRFGQIHAGELISFLGSAGVLGATQVRPGPGRIFFLTGLDCRSAETLAEMASKYGLSVNRSDPEMSIAACAGAGACASGRFQTKARAEKLAAIAVELLDGSMVVHVSGCAKGCAHPRSALSIVGADDGYNLMLDGVASDIADAQIAGGDIDSAIEKLARLVKDERQAGESAAACLRRIGKYDAIKALRQG